jgi:hypothetical protein
MLRENSVRQRLQVSGSVLAAIGAVMTFVDRLPKAWSIPKVRISVA